MLSGAMCAKRLVSVGVQNAVLWNMENDAAYHNEMTTACLPGYKPQPWVHEVHALD